MAFQVGSACYETALQAAQAYAATIEPVIAHPWLIRVQHVTEAAVTYEYRNVVDGAIYLNAHAIHLSPCNLLTAADAVNVGWLIGGVWLSISVVAFLIRYLRGETETSDAGYT